MERSAPAHWPRVEEFLAVRGADRIPHPDGTLLDHLVLTVTDVERTVAFYQRVLGMRPVTFGDGRRALAFGSIKINLHRTGREPLPHATRPTPGSADLCLVTETPQEQVLAHLAACGVPAEEGPVPRTGALGPILSTYLRDPDGNLIEISTCT